MCLAGWIFFSLTCPFGQRVKKLLLECQIWGNAWDIAFLRTGQAVRWTTRERNASGHGCHRHGGVKRMIVYRPKLVFVCMSPGYNQDTWVITAWVIYPPGFHLQWLEINTHVLLYRSDRVFMRRMTNVAKKACVTWITSDDQIKMLLWNSN